MLQISVSGPRVRTSDLLLIVPTAVGTLGSFSSNVKWRLQNFSFHSTCLTPWVWVALFAEPDYFKSPTTVSLCTYTNKNASLPCFAFCLRFAARTSAGGAEGWSMTALIEPQSDNEYQSVHPPPFQIVLPASLPLCPCASRFFFLVATAQLLRLLK